MGGYPIKRFTYLRNGQLIQCKPSKSEKFVLVEDYFGDRSIMWVACLENEVELWRHNVTDIVRLTHEKIA